MIPRPPLFVAASLVAANAAAAVWGYGLLPPRATVALQVGLDGRMHEHLPKAEGLAILPIAAALVVAGLAVGARRAGAGTLEAAARPFSTLMIGIAGLLLAAQIAVILAAYDPAFQLVNITAIATGVFLAMLGDSLGKARQNRFFGVRTRATLENPTVWDKTHRLTARLMFAAGLILVALGFVLRDPRALAAAMALCAGGPPVIGALRSLALAGPSHDPTAR